MTFPNNPHQGIPMYQNNRMQQNNQVQPGSVIQTPNGPMVVTPQGLIPYEIARQMNQNQFPNGIQQQMQTGMPQQMPQQMQPQFAMNQIPPHMMQQYQGVNQQGYPSQGNMGNYQPMPMFGGGNMNAYPNQQRPMNTPTIVTENRFGSADNSYQQQMNNSNDLNNRFKVQEDQPQQLTEKEPVMTMSSPNLFSVVPVIHKFTNNKSAKLSVTTDALKKNEVKFVDAISEVDCLNEVVESVIESTFEEDVVRKLTVCNFIVRNYFYAADMKKIIEDIFVDNVKTLYKSFKSSYSDLKDIRKITVMNKINTIITDYINDYLAVNASEPIDIDSFIVDFNDLLKVIRNNEETLEDNLVDYVNSKIAVVKSNIDLLLNLGKEIQTLEKDSNVSVSNKNVLDLNKVVVVPESIVVGYLDKHILETGMESIGVDFVQLDKTTIINAFIDSIAEEIFNKNNVKEFYIVTMDKCLFKFMRNEQQDLFIKKLS